MSIVSESAGEGQTIGVAFGDIDDIGLVLVPSTIAGVFVRSRVLRVAVGEIGIFSQPGRCQGVFSAPAQHRAFG